MRLAVVGFLCVSLLSCTLLDRNSAGKKQKEYTFRLSDRKVKSAGFNAETGYMSVSRMYEPSEIYTVHASVDKIDFVAPSHSGLSGSMYLELISQRAPHESRYKSNDKFIVFGVPDSSLGWVKTGQIVEIVFYKKSHSFVDLLQGDGSGKK